MISLKILRSVVKMFTASGLASMEVVDEENRWRISMKTAAAFASQPIAVSPLNASQPVSPGNPAQEEEVKNIYTIKSPMVGTFYRAPNPDAQPYVKVGDQVESGTIVCIIEAMKLMNEIEAGVSGKVVKILVENGQLVEFDQALIEIEVIAT